MAISVEEGVGQEWPVNVVSQVSNSDSSNHQQSEISASSTPNSSKPFDTHLVVNEVSQLPTPSPSSSPRSSSQLPIAVEGTSSKMVGSSANVPNARRSSGSFDAIAPFNSGNSEKGTLLVSKLLPPHELHDIPEEKHSKPRKLSVSTAKANGDVLKLSAEELEGLTSAPDSLPMSPMRSPRIDPMTAASPVLERKCAVSDAINSNFEEPRRAGLKYEPHPPEEVTTLPDAAVDRRPTSENPITPSNGIGRRPGYSSRSISALPPSSTRMSSYTKGSARQTSPRRKPLSYGAPPEPLEINIPRKAVSNGTKPPSMQELPPSPTPQSIPLPPMSIPAYLQLELSSTRPSPLYIYRSSNSDNPYESSKIKFERLLNFLLLPPQLEQVLYFGSLACLDAWLYTFTILPLRFFKALAILIKWWGEVIARETRFVLGFIWHGMGRFWHRQRERRDSTDLSSRSRSVSRAQPPISTASSYQSHSGRVPEQRNSSSNRERGRPEVERKQSRQGWGRKHRRTKSFPSSLSSNHKADLLQGAVIVCSCLVLLKFDASRMYHSIRGQAAIKLYVIYNVLEVFDKLLSALGQDIFECLFSNEVLDRDLDGRSKILRPLGMFLLALIYNVVHAAALFYQVITLNVAVNSYSNALLTLLMSNQFVEIKSTVFKMFQKDNIFQLTCADIVERFQLWLMLTIIALRNIVEVGGLSIITGEGGAADILKETTVPIRSNSILPNSFTILPSWSGEILTPFLLVLGSEMVVDWIKHAYISKFNRIQPAVYQRYLDVLAKDYYSNAFINQNLIKRLGLPVIPLSCLFIRSSVQTYHMFLATHVPPPIPSTATALSVDSTTTSPATTAALEHFDNIIRKALGRSAFGVADSTSKSWRYIPSADDAIAGLTMVIFFLGAFLVLLACKLVLGMLLLKFARNRYISMRKREHQNYDTEGKRIGSWGMVEMEDEKRRHIFGDDSETLRKLKEKERLGKEKAAAGQDFSKTSRYEMSAKRIW